MADDTHALTGAYALDALPEDERVEFEQHLMECAGCRREVAEFQDACADLAVLTQEPVSSSLRSHVLAVTEGTAATTVQWAMGELLASGTRQDVVDVVQEVVDRLGGWVVPADQADDRALQLDVGLGSGAPLLAAAEHDSQARHDLERHLPQLVEDARQVLERIHRSARDEDSHAGAREDGRRR